MTSAGVPRGTRRSARLILLRRARPASLLGASLLGVRLLGVSLLASVGCSSPQAASPPGALLPAEAASILGDVGGLRGSALIELSPPRERTGPRVLAVVAHPDDEIAFAGVLYKNATLLEGVSDVLTITDGAGGYKYSTLAERFYGERLTDPEVGARALPAIRQRELTQGCRILAVSRLHWLGQPDTGYTTDPADVLSRTDAGWDVEAIRRVLAELLPQYDFVLTHTPTADTHGHHQAATRLALQVARELDPDARPTVLGVRFPGEDGSIPDPFDGATDDPSTRQMGPRLVLDRAQKFGYDGRLDYSIIVNLAIAAHASQGTMQLLVGPAREESYYPYIGAKDAEIDRAAQWFEALAAQQFPVIEPTPVAGR